MKIERKEVGPRMSKIVVHGDTVYLAGLVAEKNRGKSVGDQTREILAAIEPRIESRALDEGPHLGEHLQTGSRHWLAKKTKRSRRRGDPHQI